MIKVLYVATKMTSGLSNYEKTLDLFQYSHQKLGHGQTWGGWRFRMKLYMEACAQEPSDAILILTDADDILCVKPETGLQQKFLNFLKPIVLSAEINCSSASCRPLDDYWKVTNGTNKSSYKYVNCGTMMGRAGHLAIMWKWMLDNNFQDDQLALGYYVNQFPEMCHVDETNELFYVMPPPINNAPPVIEWERDSNGTMVIQSLRETVDQTVCRPYFVHFAGNFIQPVVFSAFLLSPSKIMYDKMAKNILNDDAMSIIQTSETGRIIGVIVVWSVIILLMLVIFVMIFILWYSKKVPKTIQHATTSGTVSH